MPRQLLLHIGVPKTGTTSIQRRLAAQRAALREQGVLYPGGAGLAVPQFLHRAALANDDGDSRVARFRREFDRELASLPSDISKVVLSDEQCSLHLRTTAQITPLHAWLAPHFETIQIVVYLRRQDALAASLYAQILRHGIADPPSLEMARGELAFLFDYAALLQNWRDVFGPDALVPRIFEPDSFPGGDVVHDFFAACGLDPALAEQRAGADINPSMNLQGQALLLSLGRTLRDETGGKQIRDKAWSRLAAIVTELFPGRGWQPSRAEAASFMAQYEAGNETIRASWFPARTRLFDTDFSNLPELRAALEAEKLSQAASAVIMHAVRALVAAEAEDGDERAARRAAREQRRARKGQE